MNSMSGIDFSWMVLPAALALDLFLGDPPDMPHPVRWMGRAIEKLEPVFRNLPLRLTISGGLFAAALILAAGCLAGLAVTLAAELSPALGVVVQALLLFCCISATSLEAAAREVYRALKADDLILARERVGMIVGRDVSQLDRTGVARAALETVAENLVDGVIAPLFFFALGGVPLALAYKMVNTLDSMVGYRNNRYIEFGRAAARIDDAANFIPARLSIPFIALAAQILFKTGTPCLRTARSDGRRHKSPNAGYPEAAFAGALAVRLGGPNHYHGKLVDKPWIGAGFKDVTPAHIQQGCHLMMLTVLLCAGVLMVAGLIGI